MLVLSTQHLWEDAAPQLTHDLPFRKKVYSPSAPQAVHGADEQDIDTGLEGTIFAGQSDTAGFRLKLA